MKFDPDYERAASAAFQLVGAVSYLLDSGEMEVPPHHEAFLRELVAEASA